MPEFTTVPVHEAQLRTIPGRQGAFINEYADYIQQLPTGQAGRLKIGEQEKHTTIRRRLGVAAKALHIPLIIKRSGNNLYFWREDGGEASQERSGAIPDETSAKRKPQSSISVRQGSWNTKFQRRSPRNWVSLPQKRRDVWSRVERYNGIDGHNLLTC
jgi:hypothetical protein